MVLSEAEAEAQLAALRRQREALDRTITDLTLYLELGRRLRGGPPLPVDEPPPAAPVPFSSTPGPWPSPDPAERADTADRRTPLRQPASEREPPAERASPPSPGDDLRPGAVAPEARKAGNAGGSAEPVPMDAALSEGVLARRYGRALIEAALAALDEAGRPLHASEILAVLARRGFSLPGHDPVAALNTRLWKRSGPGGPLKRMGDAVYALVEPEDDEASRRDEDES
ncbi:hypothetical protein [Methylobacterium haplocladii]|uniref:HTH HARE-type domain-containing protein n=1 Tax=Methylobacterium haplocladii TaxID=1176176 RepID=A0A512ITY6_9HYPH|nr:hypothetical protein [Methylobacterium haplocladii]GEP01175.1 hypothetical protein MHA02_35620 [Methylobacterium haplocladii]GJD82865.1 hypothetical protein HPGCJGGD_0727 [Methylobacterium haplocladii]GLS59000.1 hypothetical protein GCM10007887_16660 [Methylobacterium haplocladii]